MITNSGKKIIGKFLLSQTNQFATHIAAGCGAKPLTPNESLTTQEILDIKDKTNLDFEMFRVPIISKGFVKENGIEKIVFKAEMPTDQRYQITEVGFFPANANSVNGSYDSKTLATFTPAENWVLVSDQASTSPNTVTSGISDAFSNLTLPNVAQYIPSDATVFDSINRKDRQEPPRFYNRALVISGNSSYLDNDSASSYTAYGYRLENSSLAFNFSQNLPTDEIRLAVSVLSRVNNNDQAPDKIRFVLQFVNNLPTLAALSPKATATMFLSPSDIAESRYHIFKKPISSFKLDDGFSWANVNLIRIYVCAIQDVDNDLTQQVTNAAINGTTATVTIPNHGLHPGMTFNISGITGPQNYFNGTNLTVTSTSSNSVSYVHPTANSASALSYAVSGSASYAGGTRDYQIIFDGMRLENTSVSNPLYSLVGYDIIRESSGYPVVKTENSNNYIEYRFGVGVDVG